MAKVLGLICSHRKMGNTEVSVREVLRGVGGFGLETELLRDLCTRLSGWERKALHRKRS